VSPYLAVKARLLSWRDNPKSLIDDDIDPPTPERVVSALEWWDGLPGGWHCVCEGVSIGTGGEITFTFGGNADSIDFWVTIADRPRVAIFCEAMVMHLFGLPERNLLQ
jgi:hypothetical protein